MAPITRPPRRTSPAPRTDRAGPGPDDERLNRRMADALRQEAEARDSRGRASASDDARANERLKQELQALVDERGS